MPKGLLSFQPFNDDESTSYLADHWPDGKLTAKRHEKGSILYRYLKSLATWIKLFSYDLFVLVKNRDIRQSDEYLEQWETSVKIPEQIPRRDTIEGRREAVECLFRKIPVYNIDNGTVDKRTTFEEYVRCLTGIEITIRTAQIEGTGSSFPLQFPVVFGNSSSTGNFHFIISVTVEGTEPTNLFPLEFPVVFFTPSIPVATQELLDKILDRVIPSFCRWTYEAVLAT